MQDAAPPRLEIRGLSKTFGSTRALGNVDLDVARGEIHAIVGQNGSGKSTLVKVVAGYHLPDRGSEFRVNGRQLRFPLKPRDLCTAGIAVVHQDLGLVDHLSVTDNIAVGQYHRGRLRRIDRRHEREEARTALARLQVQLPLSTAVKYLSSVDRFRVALARALCAQRQGDGAVILDEATRALDKHSLAAFYAMLRHAVAEGSSVVVVAHSLPEVLEFSDRVTVLRDGQVVGASLVTSTVTEKELARLMVGRNVVRASRSPRAGESGAPRAPGASGAPGEPGVHGSATAIRVEDLDLGSGGSESFSIGRGEIVGVTGRPGSGIDELPYVLTGARRASAGVLRLNGHVLDLRSATPRRALLAGVVLVPERRDVLGLALDHSIIENVTLPRVHSSRRRHFIGLNWQRREAVSVIETLGVRPADPNAIVGKLSGGNQQKVLLGKWLVGGPTLLVLHEPTQGVDVGAREDLRGALLRAAEQKCAILVISSDPTDLSSLCDRVLVFEGGAVVAQLTEPDTDEIVNATYGDVADWTEATGGGSTVIEEKDGRALSVMQRSVRA